MKQLFAALDIDFDQWWALTRAAVKVDLRSSSFMRPVRLGAQVRAAGSIVRQVLFYLLMGGAMASLVFVVHDEFLSGLLVIGYVMFMIGTAALLDHNAAIVSPDDYNILAYRPITSRTYFAARLANVLVYTLVVTTLFGVLPIVAMFVHGGAVTGLASIVAVYGAATTVALTMVAVYASLMRWIGPSRLKRVMSYVQLLLSFVVYGGYFIIPRVIAKTALAGEVFKKTIWIVSLPPAWFASYLDIAAGRTSPMELIPAAVSVGAFLLLAGLLAGRLSLDYAERLGAITTTPRTVAPGSRTSSRAGWLFTAGEARAVSLLIRSQFKNDMRFRMGVLAILPLTLIYLFMGISNNGTVGDAFVLGKSAEGLRLVTLAMVMFPTMLKLQVGRSDNFRASWIFFACPIDRTRLVRATRNVLVLGFLLPYIIAVTLVLSFYTVSIPHLIVHLVVVGLISNLILQVVTFLDPELPFSKPTQKGRGSGRIFSVMVAVSLGTIVIPFLAPIVYRSVAGIAILIATLVGISVLIERLTRLRIDAQAARLEFEG